MDVREDASASGLTVEHVQSFLEPRSIDVLELAADTSTAQLAAAALGTAVSAIVKSLLFLADGKPVLILVAGDRKVDGKALARDLSVKKVRMATAEEVLTIAGYAVGGVPPIA